MTLYPVDGGGADKNETLDILLNTTLFLFGIPIGGSVLMLYGTDVMLKGGWDGFVPAEVVGVLCWFGGVALVISYPLLILFEPFIFPDKTFSELNIIYGSLSLTVVIPVALLTLILHGGSERVKKDGFGRWIRSLRTT